MHDSLLAFKTIKHPLLDQDLYAVTKWGPTPNIYTGIVSNQGSCAGIS